MPVGNGDLIVFCNDVMAKMIPEMGMFYSAVSSCADAGEEVRFINN